MLDYPNPRSSLVVADIRENEEICGKVAETLAGGDRETRNLATLEASPRPSFC